MAKAITRRQFLTVSGVGAAGLVLGSAANCVASPRQENLGGIPTEPDGWKTIFEDDFSSGGLSANWRAYDGRPSSSKNVKWDPKMIAVADGSLVLSSRRGKDGEWHAGAVTNWPQTFQYGRWEINFRAPVQEGVNRALSYHVLLWPARKAWPPEIDIAEGFDAERQRSDSFIHWLDGKGGRQKKQFQWFGPASSSATWAVEWERNEIRLYRDDELFGSIGGEAVPQEPMWLAIQVEALADAGADVSTSTADSVEASWGEPVPVIVVDWVRILQRT